MWILQNERVIDEVGRFGAKPLSFKGERWYGRTKLDAYASEEETIKPEIPK